MLKLNTIVKDSATGLKGVLTNLHCEMDGSEMYAFQPGAISSKTKLPVDTCWLAAQRIEGGIEIPTPPLPRAVLGTEVMDTATGFKGMAVSLSLHATGCVHINVQPKGADDEGNPVKQQNFSILRLTGTAIKKLSPAAAEQEKSARPSPGNNSAPQRVA